MCMVSYLRWEGGWVKEEESGGEEGGDVNIYEDHNCNVISVWYECQLYRSKEFFVFIIYRSG